MTEILVIAGTDSSGGAGLTRDTAMAAMLGFGVRPAVTAVTVQSHATVSLIRPMPAGLVAAQIQAAFTGRPPQAVKIGMIANADIAEAIAAQLAGRAPPVVIDPVLAASSGAPLLSGEVVWPLLARATVLTPNLPEAAALTGSPLARSEADLAAQAAAMLGRGCRAVLIKGGHGGGAAATDHLFDGQSHIRLSAPRARHGRRGTGCALATAIACHLGRGLALAEACRTAKEIVRRWISADQPGAIADGNLDAGDHWA